MYYTDRPPSSVHFILPRLLSVSAPLSFHCPRWYDRLATSCHQRRSNMIDWLTDWLRFYVPMHTKICRFIEVLPSQSFSIVVKKLNLTQQRHACTNKWKNTKHNSTSNITKYTQMFTHFSVRIYNSVSSCTDLSPILVRSAVKSNHFNVVVLQLVWTTREWQKINITRQYLNCHVWSPCRTRKRLGWTSRGGGQTNNIRQAIDESESVLTHSTTTVA